MTEVIKKSSELQPITEWVWNEKYRWVLPSGESDESCVDDTHKRVVKGIYAADKKANLAALEHLDSAEHSDLIKKSEAVKAFMFMKDQIWCPAGRIHAGAGTAKRVTLLNCYVSPDIEDSMRTRIDNNSKGIMDALTVAALTQQQGGGIGMDFSTLRPEHAIVKNTGSVSSGPLVFMDMWDAMCRTIMSAGSRRGAMMGVMHIEHPDIRKFIKAKRDGSRFRMFNVSVLVTDNFMECLRNDGMWYLGFGVPRADGNHEMVIEREDGNFYVYEKIRARELWDEIIGNTYEHAEPGVIFIDRVNKKNNLWYCEHIHATNPCFAPGTKIVTQNGLIPVEKLIGKTVTVHDGQTWREINNFRVTGEYQPILKIGLYDGSELRVTPQHNMILENGSRKEARYLNIGDSLLLHETECDGNLSEDAAYLKGFLLGDGELKRGKQPRLAIYEGKEVCMDRLYESADELQPQEINTNSLVDIDFDVETKHRHVMKGLTVRKQELLPWCREYRSGLPEYVFQWDRKSKCEFLAGYFDADGTTRDRKQNGFGYQLSSVSRKLLLDVQELLKTIGVRSKLSLMKPAGFYYDKNGKSYATKDSWRLTITQAGSIRLAQQCSFARLVSFADREIKNHMKPRMGKVVSIEEDGIEEKVYCCTVPKTHSLNIGQGVNIGNCGEQPLPPNGDCDLGAINLAQLVSDPFTDKADVMWNKLSESVKVGVRFLDNVLDVTLFPTEEQRKEALAKRRIGLGITGLGNCLQMLKLRYGSEKAIQKTKQIMELIRDAAYDSSISLAEERGSFPCFDAKKYVEGEFIKTLPEDIIKRIKQHGIRNGVLLTIAPTGTTSLYYGNVSSGLEPTYNWSVNRNVLQPDGTHKKFNDVLDYGYLVFKEVTGHKDGEPLPDYMVTALELPVRDHVVMQAVCQKFIDSSISKTINCPMDMTFDDFKDVYSMAYDMGCKGCTTYRPNPQSGRGQIISVGDDNGIGHEPVPMPRPDELHGTTYKIKWPRLPQAFYVTINDRNVGDGKKIPFEIFINSKAVEHQEWIVALTRMISAIFRRGGDVTFIIEELEQVYSPEGGFMINRKFYPSLAALIGSVIEKHFIINGLIDKNEAKLTVPADTSIQHATGATCPKCRAPELHRQEGCMKCLSCGYSTCG